MEFQTVMGNLKKSQIFQAVGELHAPNPFCIADWPNALLGALVAHFFCPNNHDQYITASSTVPQAKTKKNHRLSS